MTYNLNSDTGNVTIAYKADVPYKQLNLIGRDHINWNEPIQQNFITIADELDQNKADFVAANTVLDSKITDEVTRAKLAEGVNATAISDLDSKVGELADFDTAFSSAK